MWSLPEAGVQGAEEVKALTVSDLIGLLEEMPDGARVAAQGCDGCANRVVRVDYEVVPEDSVTAEPGEWAVLSVETDGLEQPEQGLRSEEK